MGTWGHGDMVTRGRGRHGTWRRWDLGNMGAWRIWGVEDLGNMGTLGTWGRGSNDGEMGISTQTDR